MQQDLVQQVVSVSPTVAAWKVFVGFQHEKVEKHAFLSQHLVAQVWLDLVASHRSHLTPQTLPLLGVLLALAYFCKQLPLGLDTLQEMQAGVREDCWQLAQESVMEEGQPGQ